MDAADLVRMQAIGRVAIGAGLIAAPGLAGGGWIGDSAGEKPTSVYSRALGIRDLAMGVGTLAALGDEGSRRSWLLAGVAADAVDLVATLIARDELPTAGRTLAPAVAGGSALLGAWALTKLG